MIDFLFIFVILLTYFIISNINYLTSMFSINFQKYSIIKKKRKC